jgi:phosphoribosylamine-glycine ligase
MARACAAAGIPVLRQLRTADGEEAAAWIAASGLSDRRLVLKPPMSAGTDDVHMIDPGGDWRSAFDSVLGRTNILNNANDTVLVQEFADGVEYLIDTYSVGGVHGLVDVCRYTKTTRTDPDGSIRIGLYDRVDFLPPDAPEIPELVDYVRRVADAVGIRNGCGHTEVMLTADGPRLLETAARPAGGGHQLVSRLATGDCHVDRTVRHHVDGDFREDFSWVQHVRAAFLTSPRAGVWRNGDLFDPVDQLSTFHSKNIPFSTGDLVPQTAGLTDALGWVILADASAAAVEADYAKLKELEGSIFVD